MEILEILNNHSVKTAQMENLIKALEEEMDIRFQEGKTEGMGIMLNETKRMFK